SICAREIRVKLDSSLRQRHPNLASRREKLNLRWYILPGPGVLRRKLMPNWAKIVACLFFIAALQVAPTQVGAQQRGPSTPQERARAIQTAKSLQAEPLAADIQEDREWLVKWLIEVPDISVKLC